MKLKQKCFKRFVAFEEKNMGVFLNNFVFLLKTKTVFSVSKEWRNQIQEKS